MSVRIMVIMLPIARGGFSEQIAIGLKGTF